jgi:hypothetical protein
VQNLIQSKGGTNNFPISIVNTSEYFKLRLDVDIGLLDNKEGLLSTDVVEFFKVWFTHGHLLG